MIWLLIYFVSGRKVSLHGAGFLSGVIDGVFILAVVLILKTLGVF